ncbi:MAG TPA: hypothetical protein VL026_01930, partial [Rhizomicrobium sp.]|nr:hypothetical protein [Rhizomicrobium sp.]
AGIIASVLYLTFATGLRPWPSSLPRVMAWSVVYLGLAMSVNAFFGTNFGYLSAKPPGPSLLDVLAPWPWYIGQLALIGLCSLLLYYAPFFLADRLRKQKKIAP